MATAAANTTNTYPGTYHLVLKGIDPNQIDRAAIALRRAGFTAYTQAGVFQGTTDLVTNATGRIPMEAIERAK